MLHYHYHIDILKPDFPLIVCKSTAKSFTIDNIVQNGVNKIKFKKCRGEKGSRRISAKSKAKAAAFHNIVQKVIYSNKATSTGHSFHG